MKYNKGHAGFIKSMLGMSGRMGGVGGPISNIALGDPSRIKRPAEDIIEEEQKDDDIQDVTVDKCISCGEEIGHLYSWYNLKHELDMDKSTSVCSIECLDTFREKGNLEEYEIIEHNRCSAYFECRDIGNLRRMCERVNNKSYRDLAFISLSNFCEPAQAGVILATHKITHVLEDFSKQTEEQYLANKMMMEQAGKESKKQFWITTWMTVLVIILTMVNLIPILKDLITK